MTPEAIRLVRESWAQVEDTRVGLAHAFYRHLFTIAPATRRLFGQIPPAVQEESSPTCWGRSCESWTGRISFCPRSRCWEGGTCNTV
jgi:hypothetical protein